MFSKSSSIIVIIITSLFFALVEDIRAYLLLFIWGYFLIYALRRIDSRMPLVAFLIAFFTFLMSRLMIPIFYKNDFIEGSLTNMVSLNDSTYDFIYIALFIALVSVFLGYSFRENNSTLGRVEFDVDSKRIVRIRNISKKIFYFSAIFQLLQILERIYFVWNNGYLDYYLGYEHMLPGVFYKFALLFSLSFYIYMATLPSKKEAIPLIMFYIIIYFISLFMGARGEFILAVMFVVIYSFLRNHITPNDPWIGKKGKRLLLISIPGVCILMLVIMLIRGGSDIEDTGVFSLLVDFLFSQGSSVQVIGLTYEGHSSMPPDKYYSFGQLIDNFNNNIFFNLLGIGKTYQSNSVEMAVKGHSLANYLTYTYQEKRFLMGGGLGSSYIAEVWNDFGFWGLSFWSLIYGAILARILSWMKKNVWIAALSFFMMMSIIYAPRASAISFIAELLSPTYFLTLLFIAWYANRR